MKHVTVAPGEIRENPFNLIGSVWMLITAGKMPSINTMTASWGGLGVLWNKNVCYIFVRPTRHTYSFLEKNEVFSLSFFDEKFRKVLNFCGSHSGRDTDKIAETGLTPVEDPSGAVYFAESRLVLVCRKLYYQDINPEQFIDPSIDDNYPGKDYHRMYVGEIISSYRT